MFKKLGELVVAHPWPIVGLWLAFIAIVLALSPQLINFTSNNNESFLPSSYQSVQAQQAADTYFPSQSGASGVLAVSATDGRVLTTADQSKVAGLATTLQNDKIPAVLKVQTATIKPYYLSENGKVQLVTITFSGAAGDNAPDQAVPIIRNDTNQYLAGSGLRGQLTGNAAISVDSTNAFDSAEKIIAIATVLLILLLLGLVFRSVIIALLPIVVIGVVHQVAQAVTADLADWIHFQVGSTLAPLLVVVMFGVGTDYFVFLLFRYREEVAKGVQPHQALRYSLAKVGEVVSSAAATVIAAFAALLVASLGSLRTLAPGLIVGVALMMLAALTLVPAILTLVSRWAFWPSHPKLPQQGAHSRSGRLSEAVTRHPASVLTTWTVVLAALALGTLSFKTTYNQLAELPSSTLSQQAYNTMATAFPPGYLGPTTVYVVSDNGAPLDKSSVTALATTLAKTSGVSSVLPMTDSNYSVNGQQAYITVLLEDNPYSVSAINDVAGPVRSAANGSVPGAKVLVGGTTSQLADVRTALRNDMEHILPLALGIVFIILALLLRALVAPVYLLIGVVLTYVATLGAISLVFLDGAGFVGLDFSIPIVVYLFVMAIGTDYNILISSRLREEFDNGLEVREASRLAIIHGSPAVFAAALILAGTFASLLLTGIQILMEIGLAVALGVLLAANVLATRIVPTLACLRGWHFWWPHQRRHNQTAPTLDHLLEEPPEMTGTASRR